MFPFDDILLFLCPLFWVVTLFWAMVRKVAVVSRKVYCSAGRCIKRKTSANRTAKTKAKQDVLFHPYNTVYDDIYMEISAQADYIPMEQRGPVLELMRGNRFAELVDSVVSGTIPSIVTKLKLSLPPLDYITAVLSLPMILLTAPEDGDRQPEPGERGGPVFVPAVGFLVAPVPEWMMLKKARRRRA